MHVHKHSLHCLWPGICVCFLFFFSIDCKYPCYPSGKCVSFVQMWSHQQSWERREGDLLPRDSWVPLSAGGWVCRQVGVERLILCGPSIPECHGVSGKGSGGFRVLLLINEDSSASAWAPVKSGQLTFPSPQGREWCPIVFTHKSCVIVMSPPSESSPALGFLGFLRCWWACCWADDSSEFSGGSCNVIGAVSSPCCWVFVFIFVLWISSSWPD